MWLAGSEASIMSRRDALRVGLAAASLMFVAGCRSSGRSADLAAAHADLRRALDDFAVDGAERARLSSIAERMADASRKLLEVRQAFVDDFDRLAADPDVSSGDLQHMADGFGARSTALRDDLLRLQDELHAELTREEWVEVVEVLNRKARTLSRPGAAES